MQRSVGVKVEGEKRKAAVSEMDCWVGRVESAQRALSPSSRCHVERSTAGGRDSPTTTRSGTAAASHHPGASEPLDEPRHQRPTQSTSRRAKDHQEEAASTSLVFLRRRLRRLDQRLLPGLRQDDESAEGFLRRVAVMYRFKDNDVGRALSEHFQRLDAEREERR